MGKKTSKKTAETPARVPFVLPPQELEKFDRAIAKAFLAGKIRDMSRSAVLRLLIENFCAQYED